MRYLQAQWVEAGVCPAANWAVSLNLHGIQQVHVTETGGPAHVELRLLNAAGTRVMELETEQERQKKKKKTQTVISIVLSSILLEGSQAIEAIIRLP